MRVPPTLAEGPIVFLANVIVLTFDCAVAQRDPARLSAHALFSGTKYSRTCAASPRGLGSGADLRTQNDGRRIRPGTTVLNVDILYLMLTNEPGPLWVT
ncbi:hypothetical protein T484DRAFT_2526825 [Baffinella frigidus]|nr:hypothetical protein T484DRAFT_2526825 [Cryptophyta sp. CCMP2293]